MGTLRRRQRCVGPAGDMGKTRPCRKRPPSGLLCGHHLHGSEFVPGVTWTTRRYGLEGEWEPGQPHPSMLPNIYYGDYLEVASSDDPIEGPLSQSDYEFQARNPEGQTSEWVRFSYPFDDAMLEKIRIEQLELGRALLALPVRQSGKGSTFSVSGLDSTGVLSSSGK